MAAITTNHTPRNISIPHTVQITLSHILGPPHPPRRHLLRKPLHYLPPLLRRQPIPQLRLHSPRRNQVDPQRPQIQRQLPRQTVQARRVRADHCPVRNRVFGHRAGREGVAAVGARAEVGGEKFA